MFRWLSQSSLYREAGRIAQFIILVALEVGPLLRLFAVRMCLPILSRSRWDHPRFFFVPVEFSIASALQGIEVLVFKYRLI